MDTKILDLKPERVWYYFNEIAKIPRPSGEEKQIANWLMDFARQHKLEAKIDEALNVIIRKAPTKEMENRKSVCLQSHTDMVCEFNKGINYNPSTDPIRPFIDGEWVKAKGTTLGADDGIGVAASLAILEAENLAHGPLECLFTADEETGLNGAFSLKSDFINSRILLNLDSEDEGIIFIGCAGGRGTEAIFNYKTEQAPANSEFVLIKVDGLKGGHSGDDINKRLGNANKILNRLLLNANKEFNIRLADISGGNKRNAIPREAEALVAVDKIFAGKLIDYITNFNDIIRYEYNVTEPNLKVSSGLKKSANIPIIDEDTQKSFLSSVFICPNGVIAMSQGIDNFVETSSNLAVITNIKEKNKIEIVTSQRSSIESAKDYVVNMVGECFRIAGAEIAHNADYPGWNPNPNSAVLKTSVKVYKDLFIKEPEVKAIHAGLECGLIGAKYAGMDMISFGPTLRDVHSPDERLHIESVNRFWIFLTNLLKNI
ncbi:MAG: aminoacyl-histidine dipeptidase [Bacteroidales bacterium]|nr:aminoacyl-histidine dipeptidase [Bacteroidales bacterium]